MAAASASWPMSTVTFTFIVGVRPFSLVAPSGDCPLAASEPVRAVANLRLWPSLISGAGRSWPLSLPNSPRFNATAGGPLSSAPTRRLYEPKINSTSLPAKLPIVASTTLTYFFFFGAPSLFLGTLRTAILSICLRRKVRSCSISPRKPVQRLLAKTTIK